MYCRIKVRVKLHTKLYRGVSHTFWVFLKITYICHPQFLSSKIILTEGGTHQSRGSNCDPPVRPAPDPAPPTPECRSGAAPPPPPDGDCATARHRSPHLSLRRVWNTSGQRGVSGGPEGLRHRRVGQSENTRHYRDVVVHALDQRILINLCPAGPRDFPPPAGDRH